MKVSHDGAFKENSLGEEGTDLEFGGDFDWWREVFAVNGRNRVQYGRGASLCNAHPEGITWVNMIRTEFIWDERSLSDQVCARPPRTLNSLLRSLTR